MSKYDININTMSRQLLPFKLRKLKMMGLLYAMVRPARLMKDGFIEFRTKKLYRIAHNGQVCLLEKVLNEYYGFEFSPTAANTIIIGNPVEIANTLIPYDGEIVEFACYLPYDNTNDALLSDTSLPYTGSYTMLNLFEVHLVAEFSPIYSGAVSANLRLYNQGGGLVNLIKLLDTYKLAGKHYTILYDL